MAVFLSNKTGEIFREWSFPSIIPNSGLKAIDLGYEDNNAYELTMTYRADVWTETRVGQINI
jgi:hypothetical protein